jgi:HAE1 family hydrophobic/amphiphilic exporter-1
VNVTEIALRRPVTTVMLFVCFAAIGAISAKLLPLEYFPDIEFPAVFVQVPYQGSTPEEVERLITRPIEEAVSTIGGIENLRSSSSQNEAGIQIFFGWGSDVAVKGVEVLDKIDAIRGQLPSDVERIFVLKFSTNDQPILTIRLSSSRDLSDAYDMLDRNLKRRLERIEGVSQVRLYGVEKREIRIQLLADRVAAHNIDVERLGQTLRAANFSMTAGQITANGRRFTVQPLGEFRSLDEIGALVVQDGIRLSDIAEIGLETPERNYGRHLDRRYAIGLDVFKETGANMVEVTDRVLAEIDRIKDLPQMEGITLFFMDNQADGVEKSLADLLEAGLIGLLFSVLVLFVFLRQVTTTLMVALAVPASLSIALAVMYFIGISLNILSMMGLMLAVGMLIDNAVVVVENIFHRRELEPNDPQKAALVGTSEVGLAITAGTLTTVIVFLPNIFGVQNQITIFLSHVAWAIVVAMLASLFIAITMIPMVAARVAPRPVEHAGWIDRIAALHQRVLRWTFAHRWGTAGIIFVTFVSVGLPAAVVKKDMFPQEGTRRLFMRYELETRYPVEMTEAAVNTVEEWLYARKEELDIRSVYSYYDEQQMQVSLLLTEDDEATKSLEEIKEAVRNGLPPLAIGKPTFDFNRSGASEGMRIQLHGDSSEVLAGVGREVARILGTVDGLRDVRSQANTGDSEVQIVVDRERALQHGLDTRAVATAVSVALRGQNLRQFRGTDGEIAVRLTYDDDDRQTFEQLASLSLYARGGARVPLSAVADLHITRGPAAIEREDRKTSVAITASLADKATMNDVRPRIEKVMNSLQLPPGYGWSFGRAFEEEDETGQIMLVNMMLALVLVYIVMAALFESVLHPFAIVWTILFAFVGVFWFFLITNTTFSFMAMIGILVLMGVVANNGIVLIDRVNRLRREGVDRETALLRGSRDRLRPILMTVASTLLALTPLAVGTTQIGGDGPPYFPMARALIGGLAFSTVISLVFLPSIYVWYDEMGRWAGRCWTRATGVRWLKPAAPQPVGGE